MAAITAKTKHNRVTIYEQSGRPGRKLIASGGGKCNLTNVLETEQFIKRFGRQSRFLLPALTHFSKDDLCMFLKKQGVETGTKDGFHIFPLSESSNDILNVLITVCKKKHIEIKLNEKITTLNIENDSIVGVEVDGKQILADSVVVATGGKGYPELGGGVLGYKLAEQGGHKIVTPRPAMCGVKIVDSWVKELSGIALTPVEVFINLPKYRKNIIKGDLLFTHKGISGMGIIDLAGDISTLREKYNTIPINLILFPEMKEHDWLQLFKEWEKTKKKTKNLLSEKMTAALANSLLEQINPDCGEKLFVELKKQDKRLLLERLQCVKLESNGSEGWNKAMVTKGGVALKKINPETLESRLVRGLYFTGEVVDVTGPCGGFNLQWAFSSGALAGNSISSIM
jgi:predicted Rossmann fold flavoprotein